LLIEDAMHPAPEPSRSAPASQAVPETGLTTPYVPRPDDTGSNPPALADTPRPLPLMGIDELPAQLGRYLVEEKIGQGGMGVVYRVHDPALKRMLAVKVVQRQHQGNPDLKRRFLEEAELMAQLQHPGIAPLHDVGELPDGRPYFSMKLIRGRTLAQLLQERPSPTHDLPRFLAIFGQLCQTLAYAHNRHLLHRDLKPSNVMVGAFGEVQVMDWGLAKVLGSARTSETGIQLEDPSTLATVRTAEDDLLTQEGAVMGTPAYMAPEQARGELEHLDERADVFGLGALLCVLLTSQPPYVASSKSDVYRLAKSGVLTDAWARLKTCDADAELVQLAQACLAPEVGERPRHAGVVAEAVAAYQARVQERLRQAEVMQAQAQVQLTEERKRRRLAWVLAAALLLLVGGVGAAGLWYQQQQATHQVRVTRAEAAIGSALDEAEKLAARAGPLTEQLPAWGATLEAAWSALQRAEALHAQEPEAATDELVQRLERLRARLEADRKDWRLLAVYDQVCLEESRWDWADRRFKKAASYPPLQQALADYGLAIGGLEPRQTVERLRQRPRAVQKQLLALLEKCRTRAPAEAVRPKQWLQAVLALEADPWLLQFRQAVAQRAWAQVAQLVGQVDVRRYHPAMLVGLATSLSDESLASEVLLLRRTQQQYPQDFWVNVHLAWSLYTEVFPRGANRRPRGEEAAQLDEAIRYYTAALALRPESPSVSNNLGQVLLTKGDVAGAIACCRKAVNLDPRYPKGHMNLGSALDVQGNLQGAIACYKKALQFDPKLAPAHTNLGTALAKQGDLKGAMACFREALDLDPKDARAHVGLGTALQVRGDVKAAIASYTKALELDPKLAQAHFNLGTALQAQQDLPRAIACYRQALELDPNHAQAHTNLGIALAAQGDVKGGIACYRQALDLDPKLALAHYNLGLALQAQGDVKGAIACYQKTLELDPRHAPACNNLGLAVQAQGDVKGAIACYRKAIELDPRHALAHYNLGLAVYAQGDLPGAIACYTKAIELDPKHAEAHCNLGGALQEQGHFAKALQELQRGHQLGSQRPGWPYPSARWVEYCQRLLELDTRLSAVLKGEDQPTDAAEQLALADLSQRYKKRYVAAVRFYKDAFVAGAPLISSRAFNAARAAALAAAGQGVDADKLDAKEKTRLRQQALTWLRANLEEYAKQLEDADAKTRRAVQQSLQHWQKDPDLGSVRGQEALAKLPEVERAAWQQLWADVEKLLKKAAP
jgi:tetratricopeptide (TPR) repeat protein/serine/threonine protein kinase